MRRVVATIDVDGQVLVRRNAAGLGFGGRVDGVGPDNCQRPVSQIGEERNLAGVVQTIPAEDNISHRGAEQLTFVAIEH